MSLSEILRKMADKHSQPEPTNTTSSFQGQTGSVGDSPGRASGILVSLLTDPHQQYQIHDATNYKSQEKKQENKKEDPQEKSNDSESGTLYSARNSASVLLQLLKEPRQIAPAYNDGMSNLESEHAQISVGSPLPEIINIKEELPVSKSESSNEKVQEDLTVIDSASSTIGTMDIKEEHDIFEDAHPQDESLPEKAMSEILDPIVIQPMGVVSHVLQEEHNDTECQESQIELNDSTPLEYSICPRCHQGFWDMEEQRKHSAVCRQSLGVAEARNAAPQKFVIASSQSRPLPVAITLNQQFAWDTSQSHVRRSSRKRTVVESYKDADLEVEELDPKVVRVEGSYTGLKTPGPEDHSDSNPGVRDHSNSNPGVRAIHTIPTKNIPPASEDEDVVEEGNPSIGDSDQEEQEEQDSVRMEQVIILKCTACNLSFSSREDARRHLRQEHNILSFMNPCPGKPGFEDADSAPSTQSCHKCGTGQKDSKDKSPAGSQGMEMSCVVCGRPRYTNCAFLDIFKRRPISSRFYSLAKRLTSMLECKMERNRCISKYICVQCMNKVEALEKAAMDRKHMIRRMKRTNLVKGPEKCEPKSSKAGPSKLEDIQSVEESELDKPVQITLPVSAILQSRPIQLLVPEGVCCTHSPKVSIVTPVKTTLEETAAVARTPMNNEPEKVSPGEKSPFERSSPERTSANDTLVVQPRVIGEAFVAEEVVLPSNQYTELLQALKAHHSPVPSTSESTADDTAPQTDTGSPNPTEPMMIDEDNEDRADVGDKDWRPAGSRSKSVSSGLPEGKYHSRPRRLAATRNKNLQLLTNESLLAENKKQSSEETQNTKEVTTPKMQSCSKNREPVQQPLNPSAENGVAEGQMKVKEEPIDNNPRAKVVPRGGFQERLGWSTADHIFVPALEADPSDTDSLNTVFPVEDQLYTSMQIDSDSLQVEYSCTFCFTSFYTELAIKTHVRCHLPGTKELHCFLCGYHNDHLPSQWRIMKRHLETEHGMSEQLFRRFPCPVKGCKELFRCHRDLEMHVAKVHRSPFRLPRKHALSPNGLFDYPCTMCGTSLQSPQALNIHVQCHNGSPKSYQCFLCNYQHTSQPGSWRIMRGHLTKEHTPHDIDYAVLTYFECPYYACRYKFSSQRAQLVHRACHDETRDGEFFCFQCRYTVPDTPFLWDPIKEHITQEHPEALSDIFECTCKEHFLSYAEIVEHLEEMSGD